MSSAFRCVTQKKTLEKSHPTVVVAVVRLTNNVPGRLSSQSVELSVSMTILR